MTSLLVLTHFVLTVTLGYKEQVLSPNKLLNPR